MKRILKRAMAVVLTAIMLLTAAPLSGFVGLDLPNLADLFTLKADAATYSGKCGANLTWSLDTDTGVLTISGTGDMYNWYSSDDVPWYSNRSSIKTVVIGDSVTSIGRRAFRYCESLTSVTIPNSVTSIGDFAFRNCTGLTSVTIPDSVTSIGSCAFWGCTGLTSVKIPDSVTSIGYRAFFRCTGLTSVTIPDSLTSIGVGPFEYCDSLTSVTVKEGNPNYSSDEYGVLFNKDKTLLIQYPIGNTRTSSTIPDSVTRIGDWAFAQCTGLTSVTIPDSVTSIGYCAFGNCTGLTSVTIPDSVTSIGDDAFRYCTGLTSVTIPDSVTSIGEGVFRYCTGLTSVTIGNSVTSIGEHAFRNCTGLTSVTIGNSVTSIGEGAFSDCTSLTSVTIPDSVTSICNGAFYNCTGLTDVYYTGSEEDWNKISIGSNNGYLTRATIHYLGSELSYTQTHTVNNYSKKNEQYASNYLISAGTALDGKNSTPSTVIPGLKNGENMVPQGIAYYKNNFLITSYFNDASGTKKPSMIFVINSTSGKLVKEYKMRYDDGENSFDITGHVGGIAVSGDNIYVADGKYIYYIKAKNMNNGIATATARKKISGMNGFSSDVSCSYVTITDGILWTGNFYDGYDSRYKKPANSSNNSVVLGFSLNGMGDETEWQAFNQKTQPDVKIDIPDKIENIQCATVYNKKLILTTSFGRKNTSKLYVTGISDNFKFMDSTTNTFTGLPMMEGSVIKDGYMYGINESGAYYYNGYAELSKDPTDVVWKYNLGKILNMDITSSTDGDVVNKSAEFVDGKTGTVNEINFKQSWFMQDSMEYNHQLAILCSQYAMIGYDNVDDKKPNLEKALSTLGMSDIEIQPTASRNQVNYFLANRKINVSGKQYTLIFAGFIGSYHDQWYSNFDPGTGDTHQGFNSAKEYVYGKLENYINKLGVSKDDTKILITGHSRGAATANLVAAKLIKEQKYASASNVYTYAFATPNSTKLEEKDNAEYKRIFNFVNPEDFVTKCMPASWGYGRYGTTFVLPSKTNTTNYSKYKDKMQSYFYQFSGEQEYKNYITGEAAAYTAVKSLTALVRNVDLFYALPLLAGTVPMTTYAFFQNTLCHFVSHTASALDFAAAGAIIVETLGMATSCFAYRDILNYFITNGALSSHFADSHSATTYCAFVSSMSSADMYYRSGFLGSVNCPVDVEVYDKTTGELVGRIVDNAVDETIAAKENSIVMTVDGESKQYWLPSDGDFEVKLIGNDNGTMDYSVAAVDSDTGETERVNFFDVDIVKGQAMTGEVNADEFSLEKYTLEKETGEAVEPTEQTDDIAEVEIKTSASGNGTVSESTTATSGDYVTAYATPDEGYVFKGWYDGDKLVSTDAEYSFVAKENTSLTARFEPAEYTATLMVDGKVYKEITYTYGQKSITLPEVPAKAGFKGEWESYSLVAGGVTINAIYTALPRVNSVSVDDIEMNYKNSATLNPVIDVDEGVSYTVTYTSSNPSVARVDENGNVYGAKKGSTEIIVTVTDEYGNTVSDTCKVNVTYAWWQWIIVIVLFGWIWY